MNTAKITKERLQGWEKRCNQMNSTPQVLITINPTTAQVGVVITENISISDVKGLLTAAVNQPFKYRLKMTELSFKDDCGNQVVFRDMTGDILIEFSSSFGQEINGLMIDRNEKAGLAKFLMASPPDKSQDRLLVEDLIRVLAQKLDLEGKILLKHLLKAYTKMIEE